MKEADVERLQLMIEAAKEAKQSSTASIESALRQTTNPFDRHNLIGQLLGGRFLQADVIRVLKSLLSDPDASVRVHAAESLYSLGSAAGKETLLGVIRSSLAPNSGMLADGKRAATVLNRFHEAIPTELLVDLQRKLGYPGVVDIMAMQGDPRYAPFVLGLAKEKPGSNAIFYVGLLGSPEGYSVAREVYNTATDEQDKIAAAWAMFRTGGDRAGLDYVLKIADQGLASGRANKGTSSDAIQDAMSALYATNDERVRDFLRRSVASLRSTVSSKSLASLFYVQKDYAFVDDYIKSYMASSATYKGQDPNLVWRIAAARNVPEITALVRQSVPADVFDQHFGQTRPVESWIWSYVGHIPRR